jgi:hypothetical protein
MPTLADGRFGHVVQKNDAKVPRIFALGLEIDLFINLEP